MLISYPIEEFGIIIAMTNKCFGDIDVEIDGEIIPCVKSFLCYKNAVFNKLISDPLCPNPLPLSNSITKHSFLLLLRYYGYGSIEITNENVVEMLRLCIMYNENYLLELCKEYIEKHFNEDLIAELLTTTEYLQNDYMITTNDLLQNYLQYNGYDIFCKSELYNLPISSVKYILSTPGLIIPDENQLLNKIISYYTAITEELNDKNTPLEIKREFEEDYQDLMSKLDWNNIKVSKLKDTDMLIIGGKKTIRNLKNTMKNSTITSTHQYLKLLPIKNIEIARLLKKYCLNLELLMDIDKNDKYKISTIDFRDDIYELINNSDDIKIVIATLYFIDCASFEYHFSYFDRMKLSVKLSWQYIGWDIIANLSKKALSIVWR